MVGREENIVVREETVAQVRARQSIWVDWMKESVEGLPDTAMVTTFTRVTRFGNYLIEIKKGDR